MDKNKKTKSSRRKGSLIRVDLTNTSSNKLSDNELAKLLGTRVQTIDSIPDKVHYYALARKSKKDIVTLQRHGISAQQLWAPLPDKEFVDLHSIRLIKDGIIEFKVKAQDNTNVGFRVPQWFWTLANQSQIKQELVLTGLSNSLAEKIFMEAKSILDNAPDSENETSKRLLGPKDLYLSVGLHRLPLKDFIEVVNQILRGAKAVKRLESPSNPDGTESNLGAYSNPSRYAIGKSHLLEGDWKNIPFVEQASPKKKKKSGRKNKK